MAYDKVVDSSVLDAGLKQIADAIREKGGTSDNLAFPQAMADAIAAIEAGGGVSTAVNGNFTPATKVKTMEIEHNLGVIPKCAVLLVNNIKLPYSSMESSYGFAFNILGWHGHYKNAMNIMSGDYMDQKDITSSTGDSITVFMNATETKITLGSDENYSYFFANQEYKWYVAG